MIFSLARFELNYFRKQPSFYVCLFVFFLLPFFAMVSDNVTIGGASNVNFNSPHAITQTMLIMSLIGMFLVANFAGGSAVRDVTHKMEGMMLAKPISQSQYLWGRLLGAFAVCLVVFLAVPLGSLIGSFWPTVDPERLGSTQLMPYLWSYVVFVIPNFLFCSVLFYLLAVKTRSMMGMYLGVVSFFILYELSQTLLSDPSYVLWAAYLDPFGLGAFGEATRFWTAHERNTQLVSLDGALLLNRLMWLSITVAMMVCAHWLIDVRRPAKLGSDKAKNDTQRAPVKPVNYGANLSASQWPKFWARSHFEVLQVIKSAPFLVLCIISLFSLGLIAFDNDGAFGTKNWPLTRTMADYVIGSFSVMMLIVLTYYSAETVWRDRQLGIGDIVESTPIKNWGLYFPKVFALVAIITCLSILGVVFAVLYQLAKGYTQIELTVYAGLLGLNFILPMIMLALLAVFIQILSPNKYVGMLLFVTYFVGSIVARQLGLEHNMWRFGTAPRVLYSDINGFGHYLLPSLVYNLYWFGLTLVLTVAGFGLWRRGAQQGLKHRFGLLRYNLGRAGQLGVVLGLVLFLGFGSVIYYQTRVVNSFQSSDDLLDRQAEYERRYKPFQSENVLTITDVYADVDFYPAERRLSVNGVYQLVNKNKTPLKRMMVVWDGGKHRALNFDIDGGVEVERDDKLFVSWVEFEPAVQIGETRNMNFSFSRANPGFVDQASDTRLVYNGSFVNNKEIFPQFGYNADAEIADRHERRKRDLPELQRLPKLEDESQYGTNFIGKEADFINFETVVSTSAEQFAISPGYLEREWQAEGRRYFHYKMDTPMFHFMAFMSAELAAYKELYKGVSIEVYHQPSHAMNVERMVTAVKSSLDYFGEAFSPYQHRQVRIIEFPRYADFAQSFANTIPYSENLGFIADLRDEEAIDYVYFVTAHEMAHQWWGHQVIPANVQGGAVLSETLAEYSAYMVMEKALGKDQLRKFLKWEMERYLRTRSQEILEEMPLYRAENQSYIHYQKGGVVMYALRDRYGETAINTALKHFLQAYQYAADPYPTTLDLLRFLKAEIPAQDHAFIDDLFTKITLFDLKIDSARAVKQADGRFQLTLEIDAKKIYADGQGEETEVSLADQFDIGVFTQDPDSAKGSDHVLYLAKHLIKSGPNTVTLVLDELPVFAGIDPYIKMIDRNADDNLLAVDVD
ncbi:M1 family aminopeptidase [Simiduia litorea]